MKIIENLQKRSIGRDHKLIGSLLEYNPNARLLDIGCGDGALTKRLAEGIGTSNITGVDTVNMGVPFQLVKRNLDEGLPFENESFDVVISHDVIEHVSNTDLFVTEIYRVLKKGGYAVISTPNMASGLVIADLILNKQPKWACISDWFYFKDSYSKELLEKYKGFLHRRLFTLEGLVGLLTHYGFEVEDKRRHGYGPYIFGEILRGMYAANLTVKVRR